MGVANWPWLGHELWQRWCIEQRSLSAWDPAGSRDRYMLVTFEELPSAIKARCKVNHVMFMHELKNLRTAFDLLNLNRLVSGINNYGQGRNLFFFLGANNNYYNY